SGLCGGAPSPVIAAIIREAMRPGVGHLRFEPVGNPLLQYRLQPVVGLEARRRSTGYGGELRNQGWVAGEKEAGSNHAVGQSSLQIGGRHHQVRTMLAD